MRQGPQLVNARSLTGGNSFELWGRDTGIWGFWFFCSSSWDAGRAKQLNGIRGSLWPKHGAALTSPHADGEQVHVGVILTFCSCWSHALSICAITGKKLLKSCCSLAAKRGNLMNTGFLFSGTLWSAQNFLGDVWNIENLTEAFPRAFVVCEL